MPATMGLMATRECAFGSIDAVESRRSLSQSRRRGTQPTSRLAPVRIVVADGQAIDRRGLVGLIENERGFGVVGEAATLVETTRLCRTLQPDVLVLSLNLPGQEQQAAIPAIRSLLPELRIVALSERGAGDCLVLNPPHRQKTGAELTVLCADG